MWDAGVRCGEGVGSGDRVGHAELSGDVGVFYEREVRERRTKGFKGWAMGDGSAEGQPGSEWIMCAMTVGAMN